MCTDAGSQTQKHPGNARHPRLREGGIVVDRVMGSHSILTREGGPTFSIPRHGSVKVGLLLAKIKLAGMTYEEFEALI
jgi:HicA-like toxin of HicAB toxin-antitoxin system